MSVWLAVDKNGIERILLEKPERWREVDIWSTPGVRSGDLPCGSIKKLIGKELTWKDNPVELKTKQI